LIGRCRGQLFTGNATSAIVHRFGAGAVSRPCEHQSKKTSQDGACLFTGIDQRPLIGTARPLSSCTNTHEPLRGLSKSTDSVPTINVVRQLRLRTFETGKLRHRRGEELLGHYVTELPQSADGHARILLFNNCSLPFTEVQTNPLGVMHKAIIVTRDEAERRNRELNDACHRRR
jgi:hypothetical protein